MNKPGGSKGRKPITPVRPVKLELVYLYPCPFCQREVPLIAPTSPAMAQCDACRQSFPIVPVDERSMQFFKLMQAGGPAGIDPDFL